MTDAYFILQVVGPYLTYLGGPLLLFAALGFADQLSSFAVDLVRRIKAGYRV